MASGWVGVGLGVGGVRSPPGTETADGERTSARRPPGPMTTMPAVRALFVRSQPAPRVLVPQPGCRRRPASARTVVGGSIYPDSLHSANTCGLPATFRGEPLIRRTEPTARCERLEEALRRGDQAFVPSVAGRDSI